MHGSPEVLTVNCYIFHESPYRTVPQWHRTLIREDQGLFRLVHHCDRTGLLVSRENGHTSCHSHVTMQNHYIATSYNRPFGSNAIINVSNAALGRRVNSDKPCMVVSGYIVTAHINILVTPFLTNQTMYSSSTSNSPVSQNISRCLIFE